jgi:ergothioneine biosynthesis protein EgtB
LEVGLNHEQQHQELMVTDLKHALLQNPLCPAYDASLCRGEAEEPSTAFVVFEGGVVEVGYEGDDFHWDNEGPRHRQFLEPFELASDLVSNAAFEAFVEDGGYQRPDLWLSDGWAQVVARDWRAPLYWGDGGRVDTLGGRRTRDPNAPVTHLSFFEADAFARWSGARLPTEFEWEHAAQMSGAAKDGTFVDDGAYHPVGRPCARRGGLRQMFGEVWEWTSSAYAPFPGYRPEAGALGEYNGKFMNDQRVLRGGSCATSRDHIRLTYRNFFPADKRWQFTGIRLARAG